MAQVVSYHDIDPSSFVRDDNRGPDHPANEAVTFFRPASNQPHYPNAFLVRMFSQGGAHYHGADEFQVVVEGKGKLGRHELTPVSVHFARAYTPYGPLFPDKEVGWGFLTLRVRLNPDGTQRIPAATEKLKKIPNRKPWQASVHVAFDKKGLSEVQELKNDQGLFVQTLNLSAGESAKCGAPTGGDGQYVVITKGSLMHGGREHRALAIVFVSHDEGAFTAQAGASGLEGIVLNFPPPVHPTVDKLQVMSCKLCSFVYDQGEGYKPDQIRPDTPWEEIPESWTCPDCGAPKREFEEIDL